MQWSSRWWKSENKMSTILWNRQRQRQHYSLFEWNLVSNSTGMYYECVYYITFLMLLLFLLCFSACGKAVKTQELQNVHKNVSVPKYPWIASIFRITSDNVIYSCDGSLISTSHVLTGTNRFVLFMSFIIFNEVSLCEGSLIFCFQFSLSLLSSKFLVNTFETFRV